MCHILRQNHSFVELTVGVLRLSRHQIQDFLAQYIAEHQAWIQYEHNISQIPWAELLQHATDNKTSVADLIHCYRPDLPTDQVSRNDIAAASRFLDGRGLQRYVEGLEDWLGTGKMDFLDLDVNKILIRDALDAQTIRKASEQQWLNISRIMLNAARLERRIVAQKDLECLNGGSSRASPLERSAAMPSPAGSTCPGLPDGIHVTPAQNRLVWSGLLRGTTAIVPATLIEKSATSTKAAESEKGRKRDTSARQRLDDLRLCLGRQIPQLLPSFVPGRAAATLMERSNAARSRGNRSTRTKEPRMYNPMDPLGVGTDTDWPLSERATPDHSSGLQHIPDPVTVQVSQDATGVQRATSVQQSAAQVAESRETGGLSGAKIVGATGTAKATTESLPSEQLREALQNRVSAHLGTEIRSTAPMVPKNSGKLIEKYCLHVCLSLTFLRSYGIAVYRR